MVVLLSSFAQYYHYQLEFDNNKGFLPALPRYELEKIQIFCLVIRMSEKGAAGCVGYHLCFSLQGYLVRNLLFLFQISGDLLDYLPVCKMDNGSSKHTR